jgi:hypothetical protein
MDTDGPYWEKSTELTNYYKSIMMEEELEESSKQDSQIEAHEGITETKSYKFYENNKLFYEVSNVYITSSPDYYEVKETYYSDSNPWLFSELQSDFPIETTSFSIDAMESNYYDRSGKKYTTDEIADKQKKAMYKCQEIIRNKSKYKKEVTDFQKFSLSEETLEGTKTENSHSEHNIYYNDLCLSVVDYSKQGNMNGYLSEECKEEFYFHKGKLFFYYKKGFSKKMNLESMDGEDILNSYEKRIYISNGEVIRILEKKITKDIPSDSFNVDKVYEELTNTKNQNIEISHSQYEEIKKYL